MRHWPRTWVPRRPPPPAPGEARRTPTSTRAATRVVEEREEVLVRMLLRRTGAVWGHTWMGFSRVQKGITTAPYCGRRISTESTDAPAGWVNRQRRWIEKTGRLPFIKLAVFRLGQPRFGAFVCSGTPPAVAIQLLFLPLSFSGAASTPLAAAACGGSLHL
jgi:hypothetical protein